jgi:hypothetical protein
VANAEGTTDVWVTTINAKTPDSSIAATDASLPTWHPYNRSGGTGGTRRTCGGPFGLLGLAGAGVAGGYAKRRRR